ncbi:MAG: tryptophan-rich sensory protein [Candidatus Thorarchaeota archaeon]
MNAKLLQWLNVIAVIGTILLNALVNILLVGGVTTGEVSDSYPNLFTPPGYVFAIWSVIYTLAIVFMFYQIRANQRDEAYLQEIGPLYVIGSLVNVGWLYLFHFSYGSPALLLATPLLIVMFLVILLWTYVRLGVGVKEVSLGQKLGIHLHFSVYLGWISLATIANIASALNVLIPGIPLDIQAIWTALIILVALVLTLLMLYRRRDIVYALVVIWASIGIATKQASVTIIAWTTWGAIALIVVAIILLPLLMKKSIKNYYLVRE